MPPTIISRKSSNRILRDSSPNQAEPPRGHKPRLGISQCLLGEPVRYDGGHKLDPFLTNVLTPFVEWIPVCPEVEAGLGTPREAMCLMGNSDSPRLVTIHTKVDHTRLLQQYSRRRIRKLLASDLDGYIFKNNSPTLVWMGTNRDLGLVSACWVSRSAMMEDTNWTPFSRTC